MFRILITAVAAAALASGCGGDEKFDAGAVAATLEEGTIFEGVDSVDQLDTTCAESDEGWTCTVRAPKAERRYSVWIDDNGAWASVQQSPDRGADGSFGCCIEASE
jgi:hypothetical protein